MIVRVVAALGLILSGSGAVGRAWAVGTPAAGGAAPTMSSLTDQTVVKGTVMGPILFTVGDDATPADQLVLTVSSSNTTLLPNENVVLGGSGTTRTLTAQTIGQSFLALSGTTVLTVTVSDGTETVSESLTLAIVDRFSYVLAEGATGPFFSTDILVAHPGSASVVTARLTFLKEDGTTVVHDQNLGLRGRVTIPVDETPGMEAASFSTVLESIQGGELAVERTMRWNETGYGSHTEKANVGPAPRWFFAEGSQGFFFTYFLLVNPQPTANAARITYFREGLPPIVRDYPLAPSSRRTVYAGDDPALVDTSFGARIDFDQPGTAERAMYFGTTPLFTGGHDSSGVTKPSREWFLAEGATGTFFSTFVLLANPDDQPADVTVTYLRDTGAPIVKQVTVPAGQRMTRNIATEDPALASAAVGVRVQSTRPIVVERSQYWPNPASDWYEAHNSFGVTETSYRWALAEGGVGGPNAAQTFILLSNPGSESVDVTLDFLKVNGAGATKTFTVPPTSRKNVAIFGPTSDVPELANETFSTLIEATAPIVVERSFYASPDGRTFSAGTNATATKFRAPLPMAKTGPDQVNVPVGSTVTLGIQSLAAFPPPHQWTLLSKPAGSSAVLSDPTALRPTFVADVAGDYVAQLVVSIGGTTIRSAPETVLITTARPPMDVAVTAPDNTASEGTLDTATFTFTRTGGDLTQPVTLFYTLGEPLGITMSFFDYLDVGQRVYFPVRVPETAKEIKQVTIPANETTASLTIVPRKDNTVEGVESLHATLISKRDYFMTADTATITIADDPPVVDVVASDNAASEAGPDTGTFTFTRTGGDLDRSVSVRVVLTGTAFHGPDFQLVDTTVLFEAGQTTATLTITPIADGAAEGPETVILTLPTGDTNFVPGPSATATITIND